MTIKRLITSVLFTLLLAYFFANVEVQIEGAAGWAANLPTWRIDNHWLLNIFWGGRTLTGYHAWVFPFVTLFYHYPFFAAETWSLRAEARTLACIMIFWVVEDFLWFVINPAFGLSHFTPANVPWHKHWIGPAPVDYWVYMIGAILLLSFAASSKKAQAAPPKKV